MLPKLDGSGELESVEMPQPRSTTDTVWHYTTTEGLHAILTSKEFRASSAGMMNDTAEISHGHDLLDRVHRKWEQSDPSLTGSGLAFVRRVFDVGSRELLATNVYVLCASEEGDSLSQWRGYGRNGGYAIGLRPTDGFSLVSTTEPGFLSVTNSGAGLVCGLV